MPHVSESLVGMQCGLHHIFQYLLSFCNDRQMSITRKRKTTRLCSRHFFYFKTQIHCIASSFLPFDFSSNLLEETQQRTRTRLTADVLGLVLVGETVEASSRALGVSAHVLKVQPVADIHGVASQPLLGNAVDTVARRAPDRVFDRLSAASAVVALFGRCVARVCERVGAVVEAVGTATRGEDLRDRVLVVKHDAAEVAVHAVVQVEHVALHVQGGVLDGAACDDVAGDGESRRGVVTTGLGNDADRRREVGVDSGGEHGGHVVEGLGHETAANIQGVRVESEGNGLIKHAASVGNSLEESTRVRCTRANVEGNTSNVEAEIFGQSKKFWSGIHVGAELLAQTAKTLGVVREDAEIELCVREEGLDLVQLVTVVEGHLLDVLPGSVTQVALGLTRLRIDDARRVDASTQDQLDLGLAGTIEPGSKGGQQADDHWVRVALDGEVRNDAAKVFLPTQVLAVDVSKVGNEEGVFVSSLAVVGVDRPYMLLQRRSDHFFGKLDAILSMLFTSSVQSRFVEVSALYRPGRIVRAKVDRDRCHSLCNRGWDKFGIRNFV
jgi:hypothetical protein